MKTIKDHLSSFDHLVHYFFMTIYHNQTEQIISAALELIQYFQKYSAKEASEHNIFRLENTAHNIL
ncbi:hypothetical protein [Sphingobacterium sp. 2149]|uniref:hypothetical protein n=1 Tax=Sphingobacterium sp. 2149 TaxID=2817763 RepID=UPI001AE6CF8A|nr:hypothetical protein [Sphingobacterium sp. 2149]MDR6733308.1 hypothetical protein [Sphingobacterium sp. 2149]